MTKLAYVLVVLFPLSDGQITAMETYQQYASPLTCSMKAFIENEQVEDRTYVCMTRQDAVAILKTNRPQTAESTEAPEDQPKEETSSLSR